MGLKIKDKCGLLQSGETSQFFHPETWVDSAMAGMKGGLLQASPFHPKRGVDSVMTEGRGGFCNDNGERQIIRGSLAGTSEQKWRCTGFIISFADII